jgi:serine O-acetyltransferase
MLRRLTAYLDSIKVRDPAPRSRWEVLFYPGVWAMAFHRVAHAMFGRGWFFLARLINLNARLVTGIEIHPGARIGQRLFIDHGFVVIGETAEIGDDVTIYQFVTLGGTDPSNGIPGKRHPTLANGVIVGSGAAILGPIRVGEGARVGANAVVTRDVAPGATVVGIPAKPIVVLAETYERFLPYGTPCGGVADPLSCRIEVLAAEVERLRAELRHARAGGGGGLNVPDALDAGHERAA